MVLVEDVTDSGSRDSAAGATGGDSRPTPPTSSTAMSKLSNFMLSDKISAVLWLTRIFTIICTFFYIFNILGYDSNALFQKALMSGGATSALKLHQRISGVPFAFSRDYLARLLVEDSFHYLLYSFLFLNVSPVTIVLMPVAAFALLHVIAYTNQMLNQLGTPADFPLVRRLLGFVSSRDKEIMRFVAVNEIIMAPTIIVMILTGKCGIFVPFMYYRFVCMRYQSRRNPYNRVMFHELRLIAEHYTSQPTCPTMLRNLTQRIIALVSRFAPPQTP